MWFGFKLNPISGNDRAAPKLSLMLKLVKSDKKMILQFAPKFSLKIFNTICMYILHNVVTKTIYPLPLICFSLKQSCVYISVNQPIWGFSRNPVKNWRNLWVPWNPGWKTLVYIFRIKVKLGYNEHAWGQYNLLIVTLIRRNSCSLGPKYQIVFAIFSFLVISVLCKTNVGTLKMKNGLVNLCLKFETLYIFASTVDITTTTITATTLSSEKGRLKIIFWIAVKMLEFYLISNTSLTHKMSLLNLQIFILMLMIIMIFVLGN